MSISDRVKELLKSPKCIGKSQNEISLEIGIAPSVLSKIKRKNDTDPSAGTIYAIAKYFGVSADWLLGLPAPDMEEMSDIAATEQIGCSRDTYEVLKRIFSGMWMEDDSENIFPMFLEEITEDLLLSLQKFSEAVKELSKMEYEDHKRVLAYRTKRFKANGEETEELKAESEYIDKKREEEKPELKNKKDAVASAEWQIQKQIIMILQSMEERIDTETNGEHHSIASYLFSGGGFNGKRN